MKSFFQALTVVLAIMAVAQVVTTKDLAHATGSTRDPGV